MPRSYLNGLTGPTGDGQRPTLDKAAVGTRFYDATAFSLGKTPPEPSTQSFLYPIDNLPAMDFLLPARGTAIPATPRSGGAGGPGVVGFPGAGSCLASGGFRSASAKPRGRGLRFKFVRRVEKRARIDVFRVSKGRRVLVERRVAQFRSRTRPFTWNGRGQNGRKVGDAFYFARISVPTAIGISDSRRFALVRRGGRFHRRPAYAKREKCTTLASFKLVREVFGGTSNKPLRGSFRLAREARVSARITRGSTTVRRLKSFRAKPNRTYRRIRMSARGMPAGDYKVRLTVKRAGRTIRATLTSRRI